MSFRFSNNGSSTAVIELQEVPVIAPEPAVKASRPQSIRSPQRLGSHASQTPVDGSRAPSDVNAGLPSPTTATEIALRWNYPRYNVFRTAATFFAFVIMGMNDGVYGVRCPNCTLSSNKANDRTGFDSIRAFAMLSTSIVRTADNITVRKIL